MKWLPVKTNEQHLMDCIQLAERAHRDVYRVHGEPYILHPMRVMIAVMNRFLVSEFPANREKRYIASCVAILHDTAEDNPDVALDSATGKMVVDDGSPFMAQVWRSVDSVTRRKGESYWEFVMRSKHDEIGRIVKIEDIIDNTSPEQLIFIDGNSRRNLLRSNKYVVSLKYLNGFISADVFKAVVQDIENEIASLPKPEKSYV